MNDDNDVVFASKRLNIKDCAALLASNKGKVIDAISTMLTDKVVKSLPADWKDINSVEKAEAWLQQRLDESTVLIISTKHDDTIIGLVLISKNQGVKGDRSLNIGYLLAENYWGQGYASELLQALVKHFQSKPNITGIFAGVESDNRASIRVLEKCGFKLSTSEKAPAGNLFYEILF